MHKKRLDQYLTQRLNQCFTEAKNHKKQRKKVTRYKIIRNGKVYPAFIVDAWYDEEKGEIIICFIVFISLKGIRREVKFKTNGAGVHFYEDLCETVGTDGNPCDLIGKAVCLHFEKNGDFQNVRVDELISREELQEALAEIEDDEEEKLGERIRSSKMSKARKQNTNKKKNTRRKNDDFDEEEDASDFEEEYDVDDYEPEEEDSSDYEDGGDYEPEEEYLDDMSDFQG